MKLLTLNKEFKNYKTQNFSEKEVVEKFITFLEKYGEKGFFRENLEGHFTASIIVFNKDISKTLLMHHKKLNIWLNFGGHADGEIDIKNVAIRELEEEAGIFIEEKDLLTNFMDLDLQVIPERKNEPEHFHYDIRFVVKVDDNINFQKQESEVNDIKWFDVEELRNKKISDGVLKVVDKII